MMKIIAGRENAENNSLKGSIVTDFYDKRYLAIRYFLTAQY